MRYKIVHLPIPENIYNSWSVQAFKDESTLIAFVARKLGFEPRASRPTRMPATPQQQQWSLTRRLRKLLAREGGSIPVHLASRRLGAKLEDLIESARAANCYLHDRGDGRRRRWIEPLPAGMTYEQATAKELGEAVKSIAMPTTTTTSPTPTPVTPSTFCIDPEQKAAILRDMAKEDGHCCQDANCVTNTCTCACAGCVKARA